MNNNKFRLSLVAIAVLGTHTQSIAAVQETEITVEETKNTEIKMQERSTNANEAKVDERIEATGSRLQGGNIVNKSTIITAEDIQSRGVTSVEELIRSLPQNLATIGGMSNLNSKGPLGVSDGDTRAMSSIGALGVSAANLGGMGAGRTLILINGRRLAGAAGIEDGFVNLNGIPLSAIERVEITTDGASAVYGADAIGGVINFILKSGYSGSTLTVQHEDSNNGADNSRISLYKGYAWTSGHVSVTMDYSKRKPLNNAKTGYVTNNYAPYFNGNPDYDFRAFSDGGQPGYMDASIYTYDPVTWDPITIKQAYTVTPGFSGQPTMDDMILVDGSNIPDLVPLIGGPESESKSITLNFEQRLSEHLVASGSGLLTRNKAAQNQIEWRGISLNLAPGQAYNPFEAYWSSPWSPGVNVSYYPGDELATGELPYGYSKSTNDSWSVNLGLTYEINDKTKADFIYTRSSSTTTGDRYTSGSIVTIENSDSSPTGWGCYNFFLSQGRYTGDELTFYQDLYDRQCAALTSSDPNVAFNPWKSTADGSGGSINDFFYREATEERGSILENYELRLTGSAIALPAGEISYAFGAEYRDDGIDSREIAVITGESMHSSHEGYFFETSIPVFGKEFAFPFVRALTVSIAARRDEYNTEGAIGTVDGIPPDMGGELIYGKNSFGRTTPSYGFNWQLNEEITLRAKWTEGFKAPPVTNLFSWSGTTQYTTGISDDPLYNCRDFDSCDFDYGDDYYGYYALSTSAPNPDLKPQTSKQQSYTLSWYPKGMLEGLTVDVAYNNTRIKNEYANVSDLIRFMPNAKVYEFVEFYPRDENGKITEMRNMTFNLTGSEYASVMYDVGYYVRTDFGTFKPQITYVDNLTSELKAFNDSAPLSTLGTLTGIDRYKINASLRYGYGDLNATLWAHYTPSYINDNEVIRSAGSVTNPTLVKPVNSMTTFDLTLNYHLTPDLQVNFAGRNIFDKQPPLVVVERLPFDPARYNVAGRTLSLELQYEF